MTIFKHILAAVFLVVLLTAGASAQMETTTTSTTATESTGTPPTWDSESRYWSSNYPLRPYYKKTTTYMTYEPAYRYGFDAYTQYKGQPFETLDEAVLQKGWEQARGTSTSMTWTEARPAVRDAYDRLYETHRSTSTTTHIEPTND